MDDDVRDVVAKAYLIGSDVTLEALSTIEKAEQQSTTAAEDAGVVSLFQTEGIHPPFDLAFLCKIYEHSNSLRQNVDAYKTNIDGFGHVFEPLIELRDEGARDVVKDEIMLERQPQVEQGLPGALATLMPPTDDEITA